MLKLVTVIEHMHLNETVGINFIAERCKYLMNAIMAITTEGYLNHDVGSFLIQLVVFSYV